MTERRRSHTLRLIQHLKNEVFPTFKEAVVAYKEQQEIIETACSERGEQLNYHAETRVVSIAEWITPEVMSLIATIAKLKSVYYPFLTMDLNLVETRYSDNEKSSGIDAYYSGPSPFVREEQYHEYLTWRAEKILQLKQRDARWEKKIREIEDECSVFHHMLLSLQIIIGAIITKAESCLLFTSDPVSSNSLDDLIAANKKDHRAISDLIKLSETANIDYSPFTRRWFYVTLK